MTKKYQLATTTWDQNEYDAMKRVIASQAFTMGKEIAIFEEEFAKYFGKKFAIMVNSGSSANLLMIAALFFRQTNTIKPGDEVLYLLFHGQPPICHSNNMD